LVVTLFIGMNGTPCFKVDGYRFDGRGRFARKTRRNCRASRQSRPYRQTNILILLIFLGRAKRSPGRQELQGKEYVAGLGKLLPGSDCRNLFGGRA
jgi:hypothetical protein